MLNWNFWNTLVSMIYPEIPRCPNNILTHIKVCYN